MGINVGNWTRHHCS